MINEATKRIMITTNISNLKKLLDANVVKQIGLNSYGRNYNRIIFEWDVKDGDDNSSWLEIS